MRAPKIAVTLLFSRLVMRAVVRRLLLILQGMSLQPTPVWLSSCVVPAPLIPLRVTLVSDA